MTNFGLAGSLEDNRTPCSGRRGHPGMTEPVVFGDKFFIGQTTVGAPRIFGPQAIEEEHFMRTLVLGFNGATPFQVK